MVFTVAATTAFFENANQMAIPRATVTQLQSEGIVSVEDLAEFDKESLKQIADNLRRPGGRIPDPTPGAAAGATIPTPPFVFGAKSQNRLETAGHLIRFYNTIGRVCTPSNVDWGGPMSRFKEIWKAICDRKRHDDPQCPVISKALPIIKWTESFRDHPHRCVRDRHIPLAYVIRKTVAVTGTCPPLETGKPFSLENKSVDEDLIARSSHTHGLYRDDNSSVYFKLEEATRATIYADSIQPCYQKAKNGRGSFLALTAQYAGPDKWDAEITKQSNFLHTRKWKGQSNFTLERLIQQHRTAYVSMEACSQHVPYPTSQRTYTSKVHVSRHRTF